MYDDSGMRCAVTCSVWRPTSPDSRVSLPGPPVLDPFVRFVASLDENYAAGTSATLRDSSPLLRVSAEGPEASPETSWPSSAPTWGDRLAIAPRQLGSSRYTALAASLPATIGIGIGAQNLMTSPPRPLRG